MGGCPHFLDPDPEPDDAYYPNAASYPDDAYDASDACYPADAYYHVVTQ